MESKWATKYNFVGEIKGKIISKQKDFQYGIESFGLKQLEIYTDFFQFLNRHKLKIHISVESQLTHIITQILSCLLYCKQTHEDIYTLTKMIYLRQPQPLLTNILSGNYKNIKREILRFLNDSIREDMNNLELKKYEIGSCKQLVQKLNCFYNNTVSVIQEWDYSKIINNFEIYCEDVKLPLRSIRLVIDNHEQTFNSFKSVSNIIMQNGDSKDYVGIRIADIISSMLNKAFTSLSQMYNYGFYNRSHLEPILPDAKFFKFTKNCNIKFKLYKLMTRFFINEQTPYYFFMHDEYADDQWCFISLLHVFQSIESFDEFLQLSVDELQKRWRAFEVEFECQHLQRIVNASR